MPTWNRIPLYDHVNYSHTPVFSYPAMKTGFRLSDGTHSYSCLEINLSGPWKQNDFLKTTLFRSSSQGQIDVILYIYKSSHPNSENELHFTYIYVLLGDTYYWFIYGKEITFFFGQTNWFLLVLLKQNRHDVGVIYSMSTEYTVSKWYELILMFCQWDMFFLGKIDISLWDIESVLKTETTDCD